MSLQGPALPFRVAGGSVVGTHHIRRGMPNQDSWTIHTADDLLIAIVADGCGSRTHSGVGAHVGSRLLLEAIRRRATRAAVTASTLEEARLEVCERLGRLARELGGPLRERVADTLLFTALGAVVQPVRTLVFGLGDGLVALNGELRVIAYADNRPPYLGYALLDAAETPPATFRLHHECETASVHSLLLGTDGLSDLSAPSARLFPGTGEAVGSLAQLWEDARYFANPHALSRWLARLNRPATLPDWEAQRLVTQPGLLPDDTTIAVIRRTGKP